jgi:hypothetical protein
MTIDGIDLLFVLIGFILLLLAVEVWDRYHDWFEWDRDRRRQRKYRRYEIQDNFAEKQYRGHLRLLFRLGVLTTAFYYMTDTTNHTLSTFRTYTTTIQKSSDV